MAPRANYTDALEQPLTQRQTEIQERLQRGTLIVCVCLCPWLAQTVKSLEVVPSAVRQRELILTEKIDLEYSMRYETLALRTVSEQVGLPQSLSRSKYYKRLD